jgi:hypothetical protein
MLGQKSETLLHAIYNEIISLIMHDLELTEPEANQYFKMSEYYINRFKEKYNSLETIGYGSYDRR